MVATRIGGISRLAKRSPRIPLHRVDALHPAWSATAPAGEVVPGCPASHRTYPTKRLVTMADWSAPPNPAPYPGVNGHVMALDAGMIIT